MSNRKKLWTPGPWRKKESGNLGNAIEAYCGQWEYGDYYSVVATYQDGLPYGNDLSFVDEQLNIAANGQLISAAPELVDALELVRSIIADGAPHGFNPNEGDWAERLFQSQQVTSAVLKKAYGESNNGC